MQHSVDEGADSEGRTTDQAAPVTKRIWDLPTRLFHWGLVLAVLAAVISAKVGGNAMVWHQRAGLAVFVLLAFRLVWGLQGGHWSRFVRFFYGPAALWRYLRGRSRAGDHFDVGHSPLGALSVWALLAWLMVQVGSGLVADDEIATTGPLNAWVSMDVGLAWTSWHRSWGQWGLLALVGLHVAAILAYRLFRKRDLIGPMCHGDKVVSADVPPSADGLRQRLLAVFVLALCLLGVLWLVNLPVASLPAV